MEMVIARVLTYEVGGGGHLDVPKPTHETAHPPNLEKPPNCPAGPGRSEGETYMGLEMRRAAMLIARTYNKKYRIGALSNPQESSGRGCPRLSTHPPRPSPHLAKSP